MVEDTLQKPQKSQAKPYLFAFFNISYREILPREENLTISFNPQTKRLALVPLRPYGFPQPGVTITLLNSLSLTIHCFFGSLCYISREVTT